MTVENQPQTYAEASFETLDEIRQNFTKFEMSDLEGMLEQIETGETDEI